MKNNRIRIILAATLALLLCIAAILPISAMQPLSPDRGVDVYSIFPEGRRSELRLEHLALTYEIPKMPRESYSDVDEFLAYESTLRMEYTLQNPTDREQTVKLLYATGDLPEYAKGIMQQYSNAQHAAATTIEVGGERVTPKLRCAWTPVSQQYRTGNLYDPRDHAENLRSTYVHHALLTHDLPVTIYTYVPFSNQDEDGHFYYDMVATFACDASRTMVFVGDYSDVSGTKSQVTIGQRVWEDAEVRLYVLGEAVGSIEWMLYDDDRNRVDGGAELSAVETTTFGELAMQYYDAESGIAEHDWYNAVVDMMEYNRMEGTGIVGDKHQRISFDVTDNLQCYLAYDVTLGAGESTVNTVTTPVYPDALQYYSPMAGTFRYHFHGAYDWESVGKYTVRINTKYKFAPDEENSLTSDYYEKDFSGYTLPDRFTPSGAYTFTLCKWKYPVMPIDLFFYGLVFVLVSVPLTAIFLTVKLLVGTISVIAFLVKCRKQKKSRERHARLEQKEKEEQDDQQSE